MENEANKNKENVKNTSSLYFQFLLLNCVFILKMDFFLDYIYLNFYPVWQSTSYR